MDSKVVGGSNETQVSNFETLGQNVTSEKAYNFSGLELQDLLVVEVCAGTARLTKTIRSRGIRGLEIDKSRDRSRGTEIMVLDLTVEHDLNLLFQVLKAESGRIALVFISPPCGTASKARERPIKSSLLFGKNKPVPLRSADKPDQKDGLAGPDKYKTEMANQLYASVTQVVLLCCDLGLWVLAENHAIVCTGLHLLRCGFYNGLNLFGLIFTTVHTVDCVTSLQDVGQIRSGDNHSSFSVTNNTTMRHGDQGSSTTGSTARRPKRLHIHGFSVNEWRMLLKTSRSPLVQLRCLRCTNK